jgi:hypothetical protein
MIFTCLAANTRPSKQIPQADRHGTASSYLCREQDVSDQPLRARSLQATSRGNFAPESVKENPIQWRKNVQFIVDSLSEASEPTRAKRRALRRPEEAARDHGDVHREPPIEIVD